MHVLKSFIDPLTLCWGYSNKSSYVCSQPSFVYLWFLFSCLQTETTIMAPDTKENIKKLVRSYMENPNAIILCIQGTFESCSVKTIVDSDQPGHPHKLIWLCAVCQLVEEDFKKLLSSSILWILSTRGHACLISLV